MSDIPTIKRLIEMIGSVWYFIPVLVIVVIGNFFVLTKSPITTLILYIKEIIHKIGNKRVKKKKEKTGEKNEEKTEEKNEGVEK